MKAAEQLCVEASLLAWNLIVGSCRLTLASLIFMIERQAPQFLTYIHIQFIVHFDVV